MILSLLCATSSASQTPTDASGTNDPADGFGHCVEQATKIAENLEACEAQLESDRRFCKRKNELEVTAAKSAGELRLAGAEQRIKILKRALEESERRAVREIWEYPGWWLAAGAVAGVVISNAVIYGSIWAVGELRPAIPPVE